MQDLKKKFFNARNLDPELTAAVEDSHRRLLPDSAATNHVDLGEYVAILNSATQKLIKTFSYSSGDKE